MREGERVRRWRRRISREKKTAHKIEAQTIHRKQQERNDKHTHTQRQTLIYDRSSSPFARAKRANGEREIYGWKAATTTEAWVDRGGEGKRSQAGRGRRRSKAKPYHPSKTESKPTEQQAKTYERRRPQRTNTHTQAERQANTYTHTRACSAHAHDRTQIQYTTHTYTHTYLHKRYANANKIATTTRANNIPTTAAAAQQGNYAANLHESCESPIPAQRTNTHTHMYTYTCILNTCFVLVAVVVFVIIIAVAGHSRHHGCYALYFCCCCCTSTRCVVVVRYISAGTFRFRFSLLLPRLVRSMYVCKCVSLSSLVLHVLLLRLHHIFLQLICPTITNNNNNLVPTSKVIASSIVPSLSFSSFAFLFWLLASTGRLFSTLILYESRRRRSSLWRSVAVAAASNHIAGHLSNMTTLASLSTFTSVLCRQRPAHTLLLLLSPLLAIVGSSTWYTRFAFVIPFSFASLAHATL